MPVITELPKSMRDLLRDHGYQRMGQKSAYSFVFHRPSEPTVLKLYQTTDYAYTAFVEFCQRQTNPHFPRVSGSIGIADSSYRAVQIERLCLGDMTALAKIATYFQCAADGWPLFGDEAAYQEIRLDHPRLAGDYIDWTNFHPGLVDAFNLLIRTFGDDPAMTFDLHADNMMMRDDMIVITDPVQPIYG